MTDFSPVVAPGERENETDFTRTALPERFIRSAGILLLWLLCGGFIWGVLALVIGISADVAAFLSIAATLGMLLLSVCGPVRDKD